MSCPTTFAWTPFPTLTDRQTNEKSIDKGLALHHDFLYNT